jgi:hypothetical protein
LRENGAALAVRRVPWSIHEFQAHAADFDGRLVINRFNRIFGARFMALVNGNIQSFLDFRMPGYEIRVGMSQIDALDFCPFFLGGFQIKRNVPDWVHQKSLPVADQQVLVHRKNGQCELDHLEAWEGICVNDLVSG